MNSAYEQAGFFAGVWKRLTVPVRPSAEGLAVYRREMERPAAAAVLVLGATPELVDMAIELDAARVVSVERFPATAEAMRSLGTRDWDDVEFVYGDWLEDRPELHGGFDCVVCDGGPLFLPYPEAWGRLFGVVRLCLCGGGSFAAKSWAQPAGDWDYDRLEAELVGAAGHEPDPRDYRRLASELRVGGFVGAARDDGSFDQDLLVGRLDRLLSELEIRFPAPELVEIARAAFEHLARSRPETTDTVTGVGFEGAERLLREAGFSDCEHFPLADPPVPAGNYMWVAR